MHLRPTILVAATLVLAGAAPLHGQVVFTSSNLPIVVIDTEGQSIPDEPKIDVFMGIIDNGAGQRNFLTDPLNDYDGRVGIELRGSSSQMFPKKSYAFETRDAQGENLNVSLLGMPVENDWILYAPYSDKSLLRNVLTYQLSNEMDRYASRTRFCELVLNDNYRGIYVLMEKIKRDDDRVDIDALEPHHTAGDSLTGGYIIKIDKETGSQLGGWNSPFPPYPGAWQEIPYLYHYPKPDDIVPQQEIYIQEFITGFETLMDGTSYNDPLTGYYDILDVASFVDFFVINELGRNVDGYRLSTFLYKDRNSQDSQLVIGPVWDFNLAFGNAYYDNGWRVEGWQVDFTNPGEENLLPFWWDQLLDDPVFQNRLACRWQELRTGVLHADSLQSRIDTWTALLGEAQTRNFEQWPILGEYIWPNWFIGATYGEEIDFLRWWIESRLEWVDLNLPPVRACVEWARASTVNVSGAPDETVSLPISQIVPTAAGADSLRFVTMDPHLQISQEPDTLRFTADEAGEFAFRGLAWEGGDVVEVSPRYVYHATASGIVVNEIMYLPAAAIDGGDWIELHNAAAVPVDLTDWVLKDDNDLHRFVFPPGSEVPPQGFLVVVRDAVAFATVYPQVENIVGELDYGFGRGDQVRVYDTGGLLVDFVAYDNESPWPTEPDGQGPSLELSDPLLDNAGPENWRASATMAGTPGEINSTVVGIDSGAGPSPLVSLVLEQNVPNPFNPETALRFSLPRPAHVTIRVLSPAGRVVRHLLRHRPLGEGRHAITFDGKSDAGGGLVSGVYMVELELHGDAQHRRLIKMTLLR